MTLTVGAPTRAQIRTRVRFFIDEPVQANFTDSDLNWAINEAQQDVAIELAQVDEQYFVGTTPTVITLTAGTQYYPLDTSFYKMSRLEDVITGLPIPFTEIGSQDNTVQSVAPPLVSASSSMSALIVGSSVGFTPIPSQSGYQVRYYFVPVVPDMNDDSDICPLPRMYSDILAIQAAIDAKIKDEGDTSALEREKKRKINQLTRTARSRQQQNPKTVRRVADISNGFII